MTKILQKHPLISIALCFGITTIVLLFMSFSKKDTLKIVFVDVGQGDATLIQTPLGKNILIDTGARNSLGSKISAYIPYSRRTIDLMILTHPDLDHVGGSLSVLNEFNINTVMHSGLMAGIPLYSVIADTISEKEIPVHEATAGQRIEIEPGVFIDIYSPHDGIESFDANDYSIITHLHYGNTSVLLTGDAGKINESDLVEVYGENLKSDILKVGHHGSQTSTLNSFVKRVNPDYAIISAGCNNRFGHPHIGVLTTLFKNQAEILETCKEGDIVFQSDGKVWVRK
jgi:competence protein ComEC